MAITEKQVNSSINISVESGTKADGTANYSTRNIGKIDPALSAEKAYTFGASVGTLQRYPVNDIGRTIKSTFTRS